MFFFPATVRWPSPSLAFAVVLLVFKSITLIQPVQLITYGLWALVAFIVNCSCVCGTTCKRCLLPDHLLLVYLLAAFHTDSLTLLTPCYWLTT
jgi:hypothetical protein